MSDNTVSLRRKISSAGDLQSVVRTMKALAASSIGQYEKSVRALADYSQIVERGLGACFREAGPMTMIAAGNRSAATAAIGVIVFGSDQGLVGQFNEVVADYALKAVPPGRTLHIWAVGERVYALLAEAGLSRIARLMVPTSVGTIAPLVGQILVESETRRRLGDVSELHLFYNRVTSGAAFAPTSQRLLPLDDNWRHLLTEVPWSPARRPEIMGDQHTTVAAFIREYLFISLFRACAESLASENASRLAAMERADRNIDELLERLNGTFHRLRQNDIDEELFDVIAGFDALSLAGTTKVRDDDSGAGGVSEKI